MLISTFIGTTFAALCSTGLIAIRQSKEEKLKRTVKTYTGQCQCKVMEQVKIRSVWGDGRTYRMQVILPYGMGLHKFKSHLEGLELATNSQIRFKHLYGRVCQLSFGYHPFYDSMDYDDLAETPSPLAVPLYSPFGPVHIDFNDETMCHLLIGGATRMGKTVLLRLIVAHILVKTNGQSKFYFIDNKITDLNMFQGIPQVTIAETAGEAKLYIEDLLAMAADRKALLKSKGNVVDAKEFRKKYPDEPLEPVFCVIDEYGRFADDDKFQEKVIELAETAGYLDIHLIIATQRPDATSAIKPRIKANIVTRLSFTTADEANSVITIGIPDAAHLGQIQGRAILIDGFPHKVQVPYLSTAHAVDILKPFYKEDDSHDGERQTDHSTSAELPGFVEGSDREIDLPGSSEAPRNRKSNRKKTVPRGLDIAGPSAEG